MSDPNNSSSDYGDDLESGLEEGTPEEMPAADDSAEEPALPERDKQWYVLKVASNQEDKVRDQLLWRIRLEGLEDSFGEIVIPVEKVAEMTKTGKKRVVKRKLYPGYMMIQMELNDDTWYLVRDTAGVGGFTGSVDQPIPMEPEEVARMLGRTPAGVPAGEGVVEDVVIDIPFSTGDMVKIREGSFVGFEGVVENVDTVNGKVTVLVQILGQSTPVELEYHQIENT